MSYDLCVSEQAKNPYYIESIQTGVYSPEELCFYLYNNPYLIGADIINEGLCDWLQDEFLMVRLAKHLREVLGRNSNASEFVMPIFREIGYLDHQQLRSYQEELMHFQGLDRDAKQKLRADYLVKEQMYSRAVLEYLEVLNRKNTGRLGAQFYAALWNNLGSAYAGLFCFEEAADCFLKSYHLVKSKESLRKYLSALPLYMTEEACTERVRELGVPSELRRGIQEYNTKLCNDRAYGDYIENRLQQGSEKLLEELKARYRKSAKI